MINLITTMCVQLKDVCKCVKLLGCFVLTKIIHIPFSLTCFILVDSVNCDFIFLSYFIQYMYQYFTCIFPAVNTILVWYQDDVDYSCTLNHSSTSLDKNNNMCWILIHVHHWNIIIYQYIYIIYNVIYPINVLNETTWLGVYFI